MKTIEEYTQKVIDTWSDFDWDKVSFKEFRRKVSELFEQAQKDARNEALEDVKIHGKCIDLIHPWNRSVKVSMIRLILPDTWEEINSDFVNFDVLKSLTISNITQELNQLKEEFEKL